MNKVKFAWQPSKPFSFAQLILLGLLLLLIGIGTLPSYFSGHWSWTQVPTIPNIQYLKNLSKTGLKIPGFKETVQQPFSIGNKDWSAQELQYEGQTVILLLMPQDYHKNLPQTEWSDLKYLEKWKADSAQTLNVPIQVIGTLPCKGNACDAAEGTRSARPAAVNSSQYSVKARYFRAWTQTTFIIVQWYAWPGGGSFAASDWFWQDQRAQLQQRRLPWVAVNLRIPIEPTQNLKTMLPKLKTMVQAVQNHLETDVFSKLHPSTPTVK